MWMEINLLIMVVNDTFGYNISKNWMFYFCCNIEIENLVIIAIKNLIKFFKEWE